MFEPCKLIFKMRTPIAVLGNIFLDALISAACAKEILGDDYYNGLTNQKDLNGGAEWKEEDLPIYFNKSLNVYHASVGFGANLESLCSWSKRWDNKYDDIVKFKGKTKGRIDIGAGYYKNYHMPIVIKSYKHIYFYANCDINKVENLLNKYIHFIGKKPAQGYGEIKEISIEKIKNDYSIWNKKNNNKTLLMRPIPVSSQKLKLINPIEKISIRPPYWRTDYLKYCYMPI